MKVSFTLLTDEELNRIHRSSLAVLAKTGMRFESESMLGGLESVGAKIDRGSRVARIPERAVEDAIEGNRRLIDAGRKLHLLNGVTSEVTGGEGIAAKISGGCETYLDWDTGAMTKARAGELLRFIRLGEKLPDVTFVGNPIVMREDLQGNVIEEKMRRVKTAALVAKHTRKLGSMEVWSVKEVDLLVEMGIVAMGGRERYYENPCFVTAKETISPLFLDADASEILLAFAERMLPCTIIPMPITGMSAPVTRLGNVIVGNAEILGVITAIRSLCPEALVGGGTISGLMDMSTTAVSFSAPEAILQDIAIGEVHARLYGLNYLVGSGYTDAKFPDSQVLVEKTLKFFLTYLSGRYSYPLGLINGGSVFSAEQALVDLEICRGIHGHFGGGFDLAGIDDVTALIQKVGVRGNFLEEDHTLEHFRDNWFPHIFDRSSFISMEQSRRQDVYDRAHAMVEKLLGDGQFWEIERDMAREIDAIVEKAESVL